MSTGGKWLIVLIIIIGVLTWSLYKGYKIVPIVNMEQSTSINGNPVTGLKIEMTNPYIEDKNQNKQ